MKRSVVKMKSVLAPLVLTANARRAFSERPSIKCVKIRTNAILICTVVHKRLFVRTSQAITYANVRKDIQEEPVAISTSAQLKHTSVLVTKLVRTQLEALNASAIRDFIENRAIIALMSMNVLLKVITVHRNQPV